MLYRPTGGSWLQQDVKAALEHSAVLNNLLKGTEYEVKIRPYFNEFQGIDSHTLILRTPEEGETLILGCLCNALLLFDYNKTISIQELRKHNYRITGSKVTFQLWYFIFLVPSAPPQAVTVSTATLSNSSSISVSWQPPPPEMQNGIIQEYKVGELDNEGRNVIE